MFRVIRVILALEVLLDLKERLELLESQVTAAAECVCNDIDYILLE